MPDRGGGISPNYVGPLARWAMLKDDYPAATKTYTLVDVKECDTPPSHRAGRLVPDGNKNLKREPVEKVCRCTIDFGPGSGRPDEVAYHFPDDWSKSTKYNEVRLYCPTDDTPQGWETWCSKTLNWALKGAGYPADSEAIKMLLLWRRRKAEAAAASGGHTPNMAPAVADDKVIDEAAAHAEAEAEPDEPTAAWPEASDATLARLKALPAEAMARLETFLGDRGWPYGVFDAEVGESRTALAFLASIEPKDGEKAAEDEPQARPAEEPFEPLPDPDAVKAVWDSITAAKLESRFGPLLAERGIGPDGWGVAELRTAQEVARDLIASAKPLADVASMTKQQIVVELTERKKGTAGSIDVLRARLIDARGGEQSGPRQPELAGTP